MAINALTIIQALLVLIALGAAGLAFRKQTADQTFKEQDRAVEALQESVMALEKRIEVMTEEHARELLTRDAKIEKLQQEINNLKSHIGVEAEQRLITHIDGVGEKIVKAIEAK